MTLPSGAIEYQRSARTWPARPRRAAAERDIAEGQARGAASRSGNSARDEVDCRRCGSGNVFMAQAPDLAHVAAARLMARWMRE